MDKEEIGEMIMAFITLTYIKKIRPTEIVELEYFSGQSKCEYFFS